MAAPSVLTQPAAQTDTCAKCTLPSLTARTVCWEHGPLVQPAATPVPNFPNLIVPASQATFLPITPNTITAPTDNPYVALGATVGQSSTLNGGHLGAVMPWTPLVTVPSGNPPGSGYGSYKGSPANSRAQYAVQGLCKTEYNAP